MDPINKNGVKLRESNGCNRVMGAYGEMQGSIEKAEDYRSVYAGCAAATQMTKKALKEFADCAKQDFGNPSSNYASGLEAGGTLNAVRSAIPGAFCLKSGKLIFTGGSEADNQAICSADREGTEQNGKRIITSAMKHHAVLHTPDRFKEDGFEITVLPVDGLDALT